MKIYYTFTSANSGDFLREVLKREGYEGEILRTPNGKPYAHGIFFNLADTRGFTAVAVGNAEVGLDAEAKRPLPKALSARLTPAEKKEDFTKLWTAKEAYIKYRGGTLASMLKGLEYREGTLYEGGMPVDAVLKHFRIGEILLCLCTAAPKEAELLNIGGEAPRSA